MSDHIAIELLGISVGLFIGWLAWSIFASSNEEAAEQIRAEKRKTMIGCPDCDRWVSKLSASCPHCGRPISQDDVAAFDARHPPAPGSPACPLCSRPVVADAPNCQGCGSLLRWIEARPYTLDQAEDVLARREKEAKEKEAQRRAEAALRERQYIEMRKRQEENIRAVQTSVSQFFRWWVAFPSRFDAGMRRFLGEENDIIYRFVQVMVYVAVPIVAVLYLVYR